MAYKDTIKKKVPEYVSSSPEFKVLLSVIQKFDIKSSRGLKAHVTARIKECRDWIKQNKKNSRLGTMRRHLKRYTDELDFYTVVSRKILRYL